eukprot:2685417-Pyramimonas_sp.AAC.1
MICCLDRTVHRLTTLLLERTMQLLKVRVPCWLISLPQILVFPIGRLCWQPNSLELVSWKSPLGRPGSS